MSMQPIIEKALLTAIKPFCNGFGYSKRLYILRSLRKDLNPEFAAVKTVDGCTPPVPINKDIFLDEELHNYNQARDRIIPLLKIYKKYIETYGSFKRTNPINIESNGLFLQIILAALRSGKYLDKETHENIVSSILWYCNSLDSVNKGELLNLVNKLIEYHTDENFNIYLVGEIKDLLSRISSLGSYLIHEPYDPTNDDDSRNRLTISAHGYYIASKLLTQPSDAAYLSYIKELSDYYKFLVKHYNGDINDIFEELTVIGSITPLPSI